MSVKKMRFLLCGLLVVVALSSAEAQKKISGGDAAKTGIGEVPEPDDSDLDALRKLTASFVERFNKHEAEELAELFTVDGEVGERSGRKYVGRSEIESAFSARFERDPGLRISIAVDSLHFITRDVSVADGTATSFPDGSTATSDISYRIGYARRKDRWQIVSMRAFEISVRTNYEFLRRLEWMIGDWVDEADGETVHATVQWAPNRAYLLRKFTVKSRGQDVLKGTQRIGWDSRKKQVRSWLFDSEGGFVEGTWTLVDGGWIVRSNGYLIDGSPVSYSLRIDRRNEDRFEMQWFNRMRGDELLPDIDVAVVRRPPAPQPKDR